MNIDDIFKTQTMAKILVKQGQLKKSAQIYLFLLKKDPKNEDLKKALTSIMNRLHQKDHSPIKDLRVLYRKWIVLGLKYHKMKSSVEISPRRR